MGPMRRASNGWVIYTTSVVMSVIPVVNFASAPLIAWWAVADYYDYDTKVVSETAPDVSWMQL